jgi:hypothetical protein
MWKYCFLLALVITPVVKSENDALMKSISEIASRRSPNATQHLAGFLGFVLTGQTTQTGADGFAIIDQAPADATMADILLIASEQFKQYLIDNENEPEEYEGILYLFIALTFELIISC